MERRTSQTKRMWRSPCQAAWRLETLSDDRLDEGAEVRTGDLEAPGGLGLDADGATGQRHFLAPDLNGLAEPARHALPGEGVHGRGLHLGRPRVDVAEPHRVAGDGEVVLAGVALDVGGL